VREQPAVARLAIERRLSAAMQAGDPVAAVRAALAAILAGGDESLRSTWRLVDGAGREIRSIDPQPETGGRGGGRR
jgi:hypothetical protein